MNNDAPAHAECTGIFNISFQYTYIVWLPPHNFMVWIMCRFGNYLPIECYHHDYIIITTVIVVEVVNDNFV